MRQSARGWWRWPSRRDHRLVRRAPCEEARNDLGRRYGIGPADLERLGYRLPMIDFTVAFHAPARLDDLLVVELLLARQTVARVDSEYRVRRRPDGALLATATTRQAVVGRGGKALLVLPDLLREAFARIWAEQGC